MKLTLIEHLSELRKTLIAIMAIIIVGSIASYVVVERVMEVVLAPAQSLQFIYLTPPELFITYVRLSLVMGLIITTPITLLLIWRFIRPGLSRKEKITLGVALSMGVLFFCIGVFFAYSTIVPLSIQFFLSMSIQDVQPMFSIGSYVGFVSTMLLSFGLVFEMPILVVLLARFNLVTTAGLRRHRKFVFLAIVIVAAVLSPPDIISQMLLATPMVLLFELSVLTAYFIQRYQKK